MITTWKSEVWCIIGLMPLQPRISNLDFMYFWCTRRRWWIPCSRYSTAFYTTTSVPCGMIVTRWVVIATRCQHRQKIHRKARLWHGSLLPMQTSHHRYLFLVTHDVTGHLRVKPWLTVTVACRCSQQYLCMYSMFRKKDNPFYLLI